MCPLPSLNRWLTADGAGDCSYIFSEQNKKKNSGVFIYPNLTN